MKLKDLTRFIRNKFRFYIFFTCMKELIRTFISIFIPILLSKIILKATAGNVNEVLFFAIIILSIKLVELIIFCITDIQLQKNLSKNKHVCKLEFYKFFFDRPLHELFSLKVGDTKEKLNDDFETITKKYTSTYPKTITSLLSAIAYFLYLVSLSPWIALIFFAISLLQVIPPILIRKYLQVNYDDCRDIEAELTDFVIGGYRAFLLIKLYKLDNWWKKKLAGLHKEYSKIGRKSIYTGSELSGGERKKVFLSIAFVINPVLMILDEPTNSLDMEGKARLKDLLRQREGRTLLVTHDGFMDDMAGYTYEINKGANDEHI